jgi:hypothetical protein
MVDGLASAGVVKYVDGNYQQQHDRIKANKTGNIRNIYIYNIYITYR